MSAWAAFLQNAFFDYLHMTIQDRDSREFLRPWYFLHLNPDSRNWDEGKMASCCKGGGTASSSFFYMLKKENDGGEDP
jgi:hypothetical protein